MWTPTKTEPANGGTISGASTGQKDITISQVIPSGLIWLALVAQTTASAIKMLVIPPGTAGGCPTIPNSAPFGSASVGRISNGVAGALAATWSDSGPGTIVPAVYLRRA